MSAGVAEAQPQDPAYAQWRERAPLLYDLLVSHALEWPSLTCQWLPTKAVDPEACVSAQRLLLGTHTSGQAPNFLLTAEVRLPQPRSEADTLEPDQDPATFTISLHQKVPHDGEVNRARYMPQNPHVVATKTVSSAVFIFCLDRHPLQPEGADCAPDLRLRGHRKEGYGLAFNPRMEGTLASGSDDALVCLWDLRGGVEQGARDMAATTVLSGHTKVVEDVAWHPHHAALLASVGDDHSLRLWDTRQPHAAQTVPQAHPREVNAVAFSSASQCMLATGSSDKCVALWDPRDLHAPVHRLVGHAEAVYAVAWAPFQTGVVASSSADRRICLWDTARIGAAQPLAEAEEGPPELLFVHGGHTAHISDLAFNPCPDDEWVVASVAEDNVLQVWRMAEALAHPPEEEEPLPPG